MHVCMYIHFVTFERLLPCRIFLYTLVFNNNAFFKRIRYERKGGEMIATNYVSAEKNARLVFGCKGFLCLHDFNKFRIKNITPMCIYMCVCTYIRLIYLIDVLIIYFLS